MIEYCPTGVVDLSVLTLSRMVGQERLPLILVEFFFALQRALGVGHFLL